MRKENKELQLPGASGRGAREPRPHLTSRGGEALLSPEPRRAGAQSLNAPARPRSPAQEEAWPAPPSSSSSPRGAPPPRGGREGKRRQRGGRTPREGAEGHAPDTAGVGPVAGHARGQQQGRHGLVEEEVVVDELLLLRLRHTLERVVPARQVAVQAGQGCGGCAQDARLPRPPLQPAARTRPPPCPTSGDVRGPHPPGFAGVQSSRPGRRSQAVTPRQDPPSLGPRPLWARGWASVPRSLRETEPGRTQIRARRRLPLPGDVNKSGRGPRREGDAAAAAPRPARPLPSTASFSMARRSPRLQCGGRQKPRMLRPVRTRELST